MLSALLDGDEMAIPSDLRPSAQQCENKITNLGTCSRCCESLVSTGSGNTLICSHCRMVKSMVDNVLPSGSTPDTSAVQSNRTDAARQAHFARSTDDIQGCSNFMIDTESLRLICKTLINDLNIHSLSSLTVANVSTAVKLLAPSDLKISGYLTSCIAIHTIITTGHRKVLAPTTMHRMAQRFSESRATKVATYKEFVISLADLCSVEIPRAGTMKRKAARKSKVVPRKKVKKAAQVIPPAIMVASDNL
jgi:hypothetical protein